MVAVYKFIAPSRNVKRQKNVTVESRKGLPTYYVLFPHDICT